MSYAVDITSVKYDMLITSPDSQTITSKIWFKNNKMKSEITLEGQTAITLLDMDANTMYIYYPDQNMAIDVTYEPPESPIDESQSIPDYDPTILGTKTIDGKVCLMVEYTADEATTKMWIWKENVFSVRIEMTTSGGKTVIEYKNIDFSNTHDSEFELPEGVEIVEIPGM
ncbi:outer membrane lipoprotein carrier protein LolA [Chloroflexota bacterium]